MNQKKQQPHTDPNQKASQLFDTYFKGQQGNMEEEKFGEEMQHQFDDFFQDFDQNFFNSLRGFGQSHLLPRNIFRPFENVFNDTFFRDPFSTFNYPQIGMGSDLDTNFNRRRNYINNMIQQFQRDFNQPFNPMLTQSVQQEMQQQPQQQQIMQQENQQEQPKKFYQSQSSSEHTVYTKDKEGNLQQKTISQTCMNRNGNKVQVTKKGFSQPDGTFKSNVHTKVVDKTGKVLSDQTYDEQDKWQPPKELKGEEKKQIKQ